jgi:hypothetical protein
VDWKAYYQSEREGAAARDAVRGWLLRDPDPAVALAVERGGILSFPHTALSYAGPLQAGVVRALFDGRIRRVLALGVLHSSGLEAYRVALDEEAAPDRRAAAFRRIRGTFLPPGRSRETSYGTVPGWASGKEAELIRPDRAGLLGSEFSLDTFLALNAAAADALGRPAIPVLPVYIGMMRDPQTGSFAAAEAFAGWIRRHVDDETAVVATGDLVHYGTAYGRAWLPGSPETPQSLRLALLPEVEETLRAGLVERDWEEAYRRSRSRIGNDQREILPVLSALLGTGATFSLLSFELSDYAAILDVAPPCVVASALVEFGRGL